MEAGGFRKITSVLIVLKLVTDNGTVLMYSTAYIAL
jgi:hypothetical protein